MWHEHSSLSACIDSLSSAIAARILGHLQGSDICTLAVSGGRSPIPLFERLSSVDLDWKRVRVRLVDERYVPPAHPDSNERLVRQHLLTGKATSADFRGLHLPGCSIAQAVAAANRDAQPIDLALLGMGEDGHTASLFPGAAQLASALASNAAFYLHVTPPQAKYERISLSLAALRTCNHRILYISGERKRDILRRAEKKSDNQLPISYLAADSGVSLDVYWHP